MASCGMDKLKACYLKNKINKQIKKKIFHLIAFYAMAQKAQELFC